jgi:hypothetical protein
MGMALLFDVLNFFLAMVVASMAYVEYKITKDRMFLYLAAGFAFIVVSHLTAVLQLVMDLGDAPGVVLSFAGYLIVIYGIYSQSRIYKVIR